MFCACLILICEILILLIAITLFFCCRKENARVLAVDAHDPFPQDFPKYPLSWPKTSSVW